MLFWSAPCFNHKNMVSLAIKKLSDLKTPFENALFESFEKRIQERNNVEVVHILEYLKFPDFPSHMMNLV